MTPLRETWEALEELHATGLVKNIGVSNFNSQAILDIFTYAKVKPCMLQIGKHLLSSQAAHGRQRGTFSAFLLRD